MPKKISSFNPFNSQYHSWENSKKLPGKERVKAIACAALAAIPTLGLGAAPVFRHAVGQSLKAGRIKQTHHTDEDFPDRGSLSDSSHLFTDPADHDPFHHRRYPAAPTLSNLSSLSLSPASTSTYETHDVLDLSTPVGDLPVFFPNNHYMLSLSASASCAPASSEELSPLSLSTPRFNFNPNTCEIELPQPTGSRIIKLRQTRVLPVSELSFYNIGGETLMCDDGQSLKISDRNIVVMSFNDGNGWGIKSRNAAVNANTVILNYLSEIFSKRDLLGSHEILRLQNEAILSAHSHLLKNTNNPDKNQMTGSTCPLVTTIAGNKAHISLVGDCKIFVINSKLTSVSDPSANNRGGFNAQDPGGRIGYSGKTNEPDFRNYFETVLDLKPEDYVYICSDGVHDNLSPTYLNLSPQDLGLTETSWDDANEEHQEMISGFIGRQLLLILREYAYKNELERLTAFQFNQAVNEYLEAITEKRKLFLAENPTKREPQISDEYTGKLDHAGGIVYIHPSPTESKEL